MEKLNIKTKELDDDLKEYKKECMASILNDDEFMNILRNDKFTQEEIIENIGKFNKYHQDYLLNKSLKKYEDCKKQNLYFQYFLKKDEYGNLIENRKEFDVYHRYMQYYSKFLYKDFDINSLYTLGINDINKFNVKTGIANFFKSKNQLCYIFGSHNSGKTIGAIVLSNLYSKKKKKEIAFIDVKKRFNELTSIMFKDKDYFEETIDILKKVDVLVLDSFGEESNKTVARDYILIPILYERCKNKDLITIITTPYDFNELKQVYSFKDKNTIQASQLIELLSLLEKSEILTGKLGF